MPRSLPFFVFLEGWEEEECSGGTHRTFQNKTGILSAARIGIGLLLKPSSFWKRPETCFRGWGCCYI